MSARELALKIEGGQPLHGTIAISGAKNAALPLMCATLLSDQPITLDRVPRLADIQTLKQLLRHHGTEITEETPGRLRLHSRKLRDLTTPHELVRKMRASILVLGPILARAGAARVSMPGGCNIGNRPIDQHLAGLEAMGAEIEIREGYLDARAPKGLKGAVMTLKMPSVGATENLLMAAALAAGESEIVNAAREPEIVNLAALLGAMGVPIEGAGSDRIRIQGVSALQPATLAVMPDRIETGTYALAGLITGGSITLEHAAEDELTFVWKLLEQCGARVERLAPGRIRLSADRRLDGVDVMTEPFPGFPTDLQAQYMALMTVAEGAAMITETIFENRFQHVPELLRLGASITVHSASALVRGRPGLAGAPVQATDLRASSSLILAGLAAKGETVIHDIHHLDRGYETLEAKLEACGARIRRCQVA